MGNGHLCEAGVGGCGRRNSRLVGSVHVETTWKPMGTIWNLYETVVTSMI